MKQRHDANASRRVRQRKRESRSSFGRLYRLFRRRGALRITVWLPASIPADVPVKE